MGVVTTVRMMPPFNIPNVDELKLSENTIVVYFSDNGPNSARWTGGMKGRKGSADEGGIRSVCYWRWPPFSLCGWPVRMPRDSANEPMLTSPRGNSTRRAPPWPVFPRSWATNFGEDDAVSASSLS